MENLTGAGYAGMAIGAVTIGLGLALLLCQHATRASLSIVLCFVALGLAIITGLPQWDHVDSDNPSIWARVVVIFPAAVIAGSASYLMGLLETSSAEPRAERRIRAVIKLCYALAGLLVVLGALLPVEHLNEYQLSIDEPGFFTSTGFLVFGSYYVVVGAVFAAAWILMARQRLDVGERVRAIVAAVMSPLLVVITIVPLVPSMIILGITLVIGVYGQFRYFVAQGERGAFLSRFLSAQVAETVRIDGLASVMQPGEREVTVIACDLRGFTAYAEAVPSQAVIDLLGEYYDAVGGAVAEIGGTVKDYAGDGVLMLIGAPLPRSDHAAAGLRLAVLLQATIRPVLAHWSTGPHPLGMGIGVASGTVTAGAVGSSSRMEYTAVGTAVNVAARLCSSAVDGETLVDQATVELAGIDGLTPRGNMSIKGLSAEHMVYSLDAGPSIHLN
jgi:adenylate cyclase